MFNRVGERARRGEGQLIRGALFRYTNPQIYPRCVDLDRNLLSNSHTAPRDLTDRSFNIIKKIAEQQHSTQQSQHRAKDQRSAAAAPPHTFKCAHTRKIKSNSRTHRASERSTNNSTIQHNTKTNTNSANSKLSSAAALEREIYKILHRTRDCAPKSAPLLTVTSLRAFFWCQNLIWRRPAAGNPVRSAGPRPSATPAGPV